jgi:D-glutamate cyclase
MTTDEKLAAILAAIQTDPGNRGLARDPRDNLFTATEGDFEAACHILSNWPVAVVYTGFFIPSAAPACFETDGPLGAAFIVRALQEVGGTATTICEPPIEQAIQAGLSVVSKEQPDHYAHDWPIITIERAGPAADGGYYTMRGRDTGQHLSDLITETLNRDRRGQPTIGIGDGGNEIGMGKIPHETIVKNVPNGDLIHCRVPTDHLIVAGVSNWGAYALAAGIYVLRGLKPPAGLFDPDRERQILEVMVREGPLVDGVTGQQTATVDGLTWEEYAKPLIRIRAILES